MIKTVIFDIDGTMYDYEAGNRIAMAALQTYCEEQFAIDEETFRRVFREANRLMAERIGGVCAAVHNRLIRFQYILEQLRQPPFPHARTMYHIYWDTLIDAMRRSEGLVEWLQELHRQGIRIGVGSNMTSYIQYKKLERLGVAPYVDWLVTSEEVGCEKPEPRFFRLCLEKSGVQPGECLFVGDSLKNDVAGALGVGMRALLYAPDGLESVGRETASADTEERKRIPIASACAEESVRRQIESADTEERKRIPIASACAEECAGAENTMQGTRERRYEVIRSYRECLTENLLSRFLLAEE